MPSKSILIVGGGLAGLSAGCFGQMNGYATTILEAHALPGGCCAHWKRRGYIFDGCLQYLAGTKPGALFNTLWRELGALRGLRIFDFETFNVVHSVDGQQTLRMYTDPDRLADELRRLSPRDSSLVHKVISSVKMLLGATPELDKPDALIGPVDRLRVAWHALPFLRTMLRWRKTSLLELSARFADPLLRQAFGVLDFPELPAFQFLLALALVGAGNAGLPAGGARALVSNVVKRYEELGGTLLCQAPVEQILVEGTRATGVRLRDGSERRADWIVSACDGRKTIYELLGGRFLDAAVRERYASWRPYSSGLRVSLGVNRDLRGVPATQTFLLDPPIRLGGEERSFIVARHFCHDPSFAPEGRSAVTVFTSATWDYWRSVLARGRAAYEAEKERVAGEVMAVLDRAYPGFAAQVEAVDIATPLTLERYTGNSRGSIEGWQPVVGGPGIMSVISPTLPGLDGFYMAGHWTFVGGGTAPAANSGRAAIQLICSEDSRPFHAEIAPGA